MGVFCEQTSHQLNIHMCTHTLFHMQTRRVLIVVHHFFFDFSSISQFMFTDPGNLLHAYDWVPLFLANTDSYSSLPTRNLYHHDVGGGLKKKKTNLPFGKYVATLPHSHILPTTLYTPTLHALINIFKKRVL